MTDRDPMTDDERVLLEHRAAVRANLPTDAAHAAATAQRLVGVCRYAALPVPRDVERAADTLAWCARFIADQLTREQVEREQLGLDAATYQRRLERHPARPPEPPQPEQ
jgi:hypothetical protein